LPSSSILIVAKREAAFALAQHLQRFRFQPFRVAKAGLNSLLHLRFGKHDGRLHFQ
jgi:hypothetical protein